MTLDPVYFEKDNIKMKREKDLQLKKEARIRKLREKAKNQPREGSFFLKIEEVCVSNCCDAKLRVEGKLTKWYICTNCDKPCNWKEPNGNR